jgi:hypothetical protein
VGVSYVRAIAAAHPEWKVENAGVNGEPITSIGKRLLRKLDKGKTYDVIVLQGGANDILLPTFAKRGFWFNEALAHCRRIGRNPLPTATDFGKALREIIEATRSRTEAKIILTTIGCLNEDLRGGLNDPRRAFNEVIRRVAREYGCRLADPSGPLDLKAFAAPDPELLPGEFFQHRLLGRSGVQSAGRRRLAEPQTGSPRHHRRRAPQQPWGATFQAGPGGTTAAPCQNPCKSRCRQQVHAGFLTAKPFLITRPQRRSPGSSGVPCVPLRAHENDPGAYH